MGKLDKLDLTSEQRDFLHSMFGDATVSNSEILRTLASWGQKVSYHTVSDSRPVSPPSEKVRKISDLLDRSGIDIDQVGAASQVKIVKRNYNNKDGDPQVTEAVTITLAPTWESGPKWPTITQAKPCVIKAPDSPKKESKSDWKTAVILPDTQIGYRFLKDDKGVSYLDPFHDEKALDVALQITKAANPDLVIWLGDFLDLPMFSKYTQEPSFQQTLQPTIDRGHRLLVEAKAAAPDADHILLEGNHDWRINEFIMRNAAAAFGIQQANIPDSWPVFSVPHLLRMDEIKVTYNAGYGANIYWINDNLACIHGNKVRSSGSTAAAVIDDERVSIIFGHIHRIERQHKTRRTRTGGKSNFAASVGCLCRTDGSVPSVKSGVDPMGRPIVSQENWQQGVGIVTYKDGDSLFHLEEIPIHDGWAIWNKTEFTAS